MIIILFVLQVTAPPIPDFNKKVDYVAWYHKQLQGDAPAGENAWPLYAQAFTTLEAGKTFDGFRAAKAPPAPWDPASQAAWESSFEANKQRLKQFEEAAKKPFLLPPADFEGTDPVMSHLSVRWLGGFRQCAAGVSEAIWRMESDHVNERSFVYGCATTLRAAQQLERAPLSVQFLVAAALRAMVYEDLRYGLHHNVFSAKGREAAGKLLDQVDRPTPTLAATMHCELAAMYDVIQNAAFHLPIQPDVSGGAYGALMDAFRENRIQPADAARAMQQHCEVIATADGKSVRETIAASFQSLSNDYGPLAAYTVSPRLAEMRLRTEMLRRGTRLVIALHKFKDHSGDWPKSLDELKLTDRTLTTDPFSGEMFHYRMTDGSPLLYSVGLDAVDDGGRHDEEKWFADVPSGDFVLWPVQY